LLVLFLLAYVSLDLTSPSIPGAFVLDADESVELTTSRLEGMTPIVGVAAAPVSTPGQARAYPDYRPRVRRPSRSVFTAVEQRLSRCLPRVHCSVPSSPEDPS
jgi:hypothetical protein